MSDNPNSIVAKQLAIGTAVVVTVVGAALAVGAYLGRSGGEPAERVPVDAVTACQKAIESHLKFPDSARFKWTGSEARIDGGRYYVWEDFTAMDARGVERSQRGMCTFPPARSIDTPDVRIQ